MNRAGPTGFGLPEQTDKPQGVSWVDGTLFFHTRNHQVLDVSISSAVQLTVEEIRDLTGLRKEHVKDIEELVTQLGGRVKLVSSFGDWMRIQLPPELLLMEDISIPDSIPSGQCDFLDVSRRNLRDTGYDHRLENVLHVVANGLRGIGLDAAVSHLDISTPGRLDGVGRGVSREQKSPGRMHHSRRGLMQGNGNEGISIDGINLYQLSAVGYDLFLSNKSQMVVNLTTYINQPVFCSVCSGSNGDYLAGEDTGSIDSACVELIQGIEFTLTPVDNDLKENIVIIKYDNLSSAVVKTCREAPITCENIDAFPVPPTKDSFVFGFPLYEYAAPNVLYNGSMTLRINGTAEYRDLGQLIFNFFNASVFTLRELYGIDPDLQGTSETIQGTTSYVTQGNAAVNRSSVNEYLSLLGLVPHSELRFGGFSVQNNVSLCTDTDDCVEPLLDVQTLQAFAPNATTYFSPTKADIGKTTAQVSEIFLTFIEDYLQAEVRADVVSLSWSSGYGGESTINSLENVMKKLAAAGITVLVSSGDAGASGVLSDECNPPENPLIGNYIAQAWPTASQWVTSVGGTQFLGVGPNLESQEVACSSTTDAGPTSGGGFSGSWLDVETPDWQRPFVEKYLQGNNATTFPKFPKDNTTGYNPQGRGFPDISAYSSWIPTLDSSGAIGMSSGTSFSAPLTASIFTLANQKLISKGYKKIGYANPMLYWMAADCPEAFNDITIGNNVANKGGSSCLYGFPAAQGWDPVTGLGTINFGPFVDCAMKWQDLTTSSASSDMNEVTSKALQGWNAPYIATIIILYSVHIVTWL